MNPDDIYNKICSFTPNSEQIRALDALTNWNIAENPLILRLPCGYGKTESVVVPFFSQAITSQWTIAPRLIYVLPTRALCNQIRDRICKYSEKVHEITGKTLTVGIEHGTNSLDPLFFSDICITTFDQLLYGYARAKRQVGRHFDLPAGAIANSIVVFDEAHLYSPYTHSLMRAMIEILVASRIPVIIMTATMPVSLQKDLLKGVQDSNPRSIDFNGKWPEYMAKRSIKWRQEEWGLLNNGRITDGLNDILRENKDKKILIVTNRIDTAQKLGGMLKDRPEFIELLHSRFTVKDREKREKIVCKYFGKDKSYRKPGIIISTQVCEVGLDISCDILITECPSADALVQRAGRVARWGGNGEVIIVRPMGSDEWLKDEQWGEAFPYVDRKKYGATEYSGIKEGEFAGITWEYLRQKAKSNLFNDWDATTALCNSMNYHTDDVEARSALGQLFESTLYADERPWNLSARGDLYCTLAIVSAQERDSETIVKKVAKGRKKKVQEAQIHYNELRQYSINVPFRYLVNKDTKRLREYDFEECKVKGELGKARVSPFKTYLIDTSGYYDEHIGLIISPKEKHNETEEASSCLIL